MQAKLVTVPDIPVTTLAAEEQAVVGATPDTTSTDSKSFGELISQLAQKLNPRASAQHSQPGLPTGVASKTSSQSPLETDIPPETDVEDDPPDSCLPNQAPVEAVLTLVAPPILFVPVPVIANQSSQMPVLDSAHCPKEGIVVLKPKNFCSVEQSLTSPPSGADGSSTNSPKLDAVEGSAVIVPPLEDELTTSSPLPRLASSPRPRFGLDHPVPISVPEHEPILEHELKPVLLTDGIVPSEPQPDRFPARSVISGTTSAKTPHNMLKAAEIDLVQPENDPKLPGSVPPLRAEVADRLPLPSTHGLTAESDFGARVLEVSDSTTVSVSDPVRADAVRLVEKLHTAIANCALEFKKVRPESMTVVIRPDPDTAVHLQMRVVDGEVRVAAHLELGDFTRLNSHWGELQQALSTQKINLGDLCDGSNFLSGVPNSLPPLRSESPATSFNAGNQERQTAQYDNEDQPSPRWQQPHEQPTPDPQESQPVRPRRRPWQSWA